MHAQLCKICKPKPAREHWTSWPGCRRWHGRDKTYQAKKKVHRQPESSRGLSPEALHVYRTIQPPSLPQHASERCSGSPRRRLRHLSERAATSTTNIIPASQTTIRDIACAVRTRMAGRVGERMPDGREQETTLSAVQIQHPQRTANKSDSHIKNSGDEELTY